jgi:cytochrome c oxidase subunit 2
MQFNQWHMIAFWVCAGVSLVIFCVLIYSLIQFRKTKKTHFHRSLVSEIVWTTIPFLILIALTIPAIKVLQQKQNTSDSDEITLNYHSKATAD